MQVLLPALRSDLASLQLPSDRLRPAKTAQATKPEKNIKPSSQNPSASVLTAQHCTKGFAQPAVSTKAADPTVDIYSHPSRQCGGRQSSAVSPPSSLNAEAAAPSAAESITASEAAAVADDILIQPFNQQSADGTCVSPNIGRRSTPFSTSEPRNLSVSKQRQDASKAEAFSQQNTTLQDDMIASRSIGDAEELAEGRWQESLMQEDQQEPSSSVGGNCSAGCGEQPGGCEQRPYLSCCVRLSEEKEPHRWTLLRAMHCAITHASCFEASVILSEQEKLVPGTAQTQG